MTIQEILTQGFGHRLLNPFVLQHGTPYRKQPLPKGFKRGTPRMCYRNSARLALRRGLIYVEGFAKFLNIDHATGHAWCVEPGSDLVIDVTNDGFTEYYGIAFRTDFLREYMKQYPDNCLLDNWENEWPILKTSPNRFLYTHEARTA